jgi:hypothetical protein
MPAGFNKGQIEYIKAVANVNGHKTYKPIIFPPTRNYTEDHLNDTHDSNTYFRAFCLTRSPLVRDHSAASPANRIIELSDLASMTELDALNISHVADTDNPVERRTAECFLESTHLNMRMCQLNATGGAFSDLHSEYRMIVFRARDVQNDDEVKAMDHSNWLYNLFHGRQNYKIGFLGGQRLDESHGTITYYNNSDATAANTFWADQVGCMTLPVNKEDYVVMKDHRFMLGKEYGGRNLFETTLHWDWQDPIAIDGDKLDLIENDKNYCWFIVIMGRSNSSDGTAPYLNIRIEGTTHVTSG